MRYRATVDCSPIAARLTSIVAGALSRGRPAVEVRASPTRSRDERNQAMRARARHIPVKTRFGYHLIEITGRTD
jgi:hypothetical protein